MCYIHKCDTTAPYITSKVQELTEWKLANKVTAFVSDSGANISAALHNFDCQDVPFSAHRLNSCATAIFSKRKIKIKEQQQLEHQQEATQMTLRSARGGVSSQSKSNLNHAQQSRVKQLPGNHITSKSLMTMVL